VAAEEEVEGNAAPQTAKAGSRGGGNPLGTPHPEPPVEGSSGGEDALHKGPRKRMMWTNEEDILLLRGVQHNGEGNWAAILRCAPFTIPPPALGASVARRRGPNSSPACGGGAWIGSLQSPARGVHAPTPQQHAASAAVERHQAQDPASPLRRARRDHQGPRHGAHPVCPACFLSSCTGHPTPARGGGSLGE
jgi:hypothetical protein